MCNIYYKHSNSLSWVILTHSTRRATIVACTQSSVTRRATLVAAIKWKMNNVFILFQQLSTSKYISILAPCPPQMQLDLTTSLQLVVCMCKQVTKELLLSSLQPTKIVYIFLKDISVYCGRRGCTYFKGKVAFLTLIAIHIYKTIPTLPFVARTMTLMSLVPIDPL